MTRNYQLPPTDSHNEIVRQGVTRLKQEYGVTYIAMARHARLSKVYFQEWKAGKYNLPPSTLDRIRQHLEKFDVL